jgi:tRNA threonylcarbamoyladenosine biosynthesis protein TsaB
MTVLGIDTATSRGSVALARRGQLLASQTLVEHGAHARDLLPEIDRLLERCGVRPPDLLGIAVTVGPGSFTGVRVGLATAKGLAYSLGIGLHGMSTLEALALMAIADRDVAPSRLCAALEAGRGEVYAAVFRVENGRPIRETADLSYRPADLLSVLTSGTVLVGDGSDSLQRASRGAGLVIEVVDRSSPLAGAVALEGGRTLRPGTPYRPGEPRPNYVRPSDAEAARR